MVRGSSAGVAGRWADDYRRGTYSIATAGCTCDVEQEQRSEATSGLDLGLHEELVRQGIWHRRTQARVYRAPVCALQRPLAYAIPMTVRLLHPGTWIPVVGVKKNVKLGVLVTSDVFYMYIREFGQL